MTVKLPKYLKGGLSRIVDMDIKKRVISFLKSEKGGVSKKALIDGAVAAGIVFALSQSVAGAYVHTNSASVSVDVSPDAPQATDANVSASHTNHSNHSNHANY